MKVYYSAYHKKILMKFLVVQTVDIAFFNQKNKDTILLIKTDKHQSPFPVTEATSTIKSNLIKRQLPCFNFRVFHLSPCFTNTLLL